MTNPVKNEEALVVKFTETVSTLALLNIYWVLSALLVLPIFSATEAVFYCLNRHVETRETKFGRVFFSYVKNNLFSSLKRQGLPILVLLIAILDTLVIYNLPTTSALRSLLLGVFIVLSLLICFIFMYQLAYLFSSNRKGQSVKARFLQALYAVIRYPQYSFSLVLVLLTYTLIALYFVPMLIFFSLSFPAYCFT
ncbi:MAG: DUF624 domain-containing protein, partial [Alkalibacterium sp.]